jgi:hypothetical protein
MTDSGKQLPQKPFRPTALVVFAVLFAAFFSSGCVQRRMLIRSNPPGARVYVDDYEIGDTPVSANFTYYGTRKIRLVKDGCETLTVMQPFPTPWYEYVPLDFVSENLLPGKITDKRVLDYQLRPQIVAPPEQLRARGEELRRGAHGSAATPTVPPATGYSQTQPQPQLQPQPAVPGGYLPPASPAPGSSPPYSAPPVSTLPGSTGMIPPPSGIGGQNVQPIQP